MEGNDISNGNRYMRIIAENTGSESVLYLDGETAKPLFKGNHRDVLRCILENDGIISAEVAHELDLDPSQVSRIVTKLYNMQVVTKRDRSENGESLHVMYDHIIIDPVVFNGEMID